MKLIKKYKYKKFNRIDGEKRLYQTGKIKVPSVTTILKQTQPEEKTKSLEKWKQRVGKKEAEKIRDDAGALGTALHKWPILSSAELFLILMKYGDAKFIWQEKITREQQTSLESLTANQPSLILNKPIGQSVKNGLRTIIFN